MRFLRCCGSRVNIERSFSASILLNTNNFSFPCFHKFDHSQKVDNVHNNLQQTAPHIDTLEIIRRHLQCNVCNVFKFRYVITE